MAKPPPIPLGKDPPKNIPEPERVKVHSLSHAQRCAAFGTFAFKFAPTDGAPERIEINTAWLSKNIVVLPLPHLNHINGGQPVKARLHRLAAPRVLALFDAWRKAGLTSRIITWNGSFVARYKRGKGGGDLRDLSNHSWGTAFDINAQWNRLGQQPMVAEELGSVIPLVSLANDHGFAWGGDFGNPDGMHFELAVLG